MVTGRSGGFSQPQGRPEADLRSAERPRGRAVLRPLRQLPSAIRPLPPGRASCQLACARRTTRKLKFDLLVFEFVPL